MLSLNTILDNFLNQIFLKMWKYWLVNTIDCSVCRLGNFLNVMLGADSHWVLVSIQLLSKGLYMAEHSV